MADFVRREEEDRSEDHDRRLGQGIEVGPVPPYAWSLDGEHVAYRVDTRLFSTEALLQTAYKMTDRCHVLLHLDHDRPEIAWAILSAKPGFSRVQELVGEFANELVDQQLRERLGREFGPIQTMVVAQAFAESNLMETDRDDGDYHSDPHGAGLRR